MYARPQFRTVPCMAAPFQPCFWLAVAFQPLLLAALSSRCCSCHPLLDSTLHDCSSLSFPLPLTFMLIWLPLHKERTIYGFERSFSLRKECFEGIRTHVLSRSTSSIYPHGYSVFNSDHLAIIYQNWLRSLYYRWQWRCTCMLSTKRIVRGWELVTWLLV